MRLSRPCYDKFRRCPGWAGGGMRFAKRDRCDNGRVEGIYDKRFYRWRFNRCNTCDVVVLPIVVEYLDWRYWQYKISRWIR
jgi:hypothetical protein